jgi:SPOR domain
LRQVPWRENKLSPIAIAMFLQQHPQPKSHYHHPDNIHAQQQAARPPAVAQQAAGQTDYVVQVATFRSESEAADEFRRLQSRHPHFLGTLQQRVQRVELGASGTFYRLGVGPLSTKDQAHGLCKSLIAAGEKVCWVRLLSEKSISVYQTPRAETAPPLVNVQQPAGERAAQPQRQKAYRRAAATRAAQAKQTRAVRKLQIIRTKPARATATGAARAAQHFSQHVVTLVEAARWNTRGFKDYTGQARHEPPGEGSQASPEFPLSWSVCALR